VDPKAFVIPLARRLVSGSGSFDGIVVASFLPSAPRGFFRTADVGERGVVSVIHPDGFVLFREPSRDAATGKSAADNPVFQAADRTRGDGVIEGPLVPNGPVFISAFHPIAAPPLIVTVSLDRSEVLTHWYHQVSGSLAFFAVMAAL